MTRLVSGTSWHVEAVDHPRRWSTHFSVKNLNPGAFVAAETELPASR